MFLCRVALFERPLPHCCRYSELTQLASRSCRANQLETERQRRWWRAARSVCRVIKSAARCQSPRAELAQGSHGGNPLRHTRRTLTHDVIFALNTRLHVKTTSCQLPLITGLLAARRTRRTVTRPCNNDSARDHNAVYGLVRRCPGPGSGGLTSRHRWQGIATQPTPPHVTMTYSS